MVGLLLVAAANTRGRVCFCSCALRSAVVSQNDTSLRGAGRMGSVALEEPVQPVNATRASSRPGTRENDIRREALLRISRRGSFIFIAFCN